MAGFMLNFTGFVLNVTGFVLDKWGVVSNMTESVLKTNKFAISTT